MAIGYHLCCWYTAVCVTSPANILRRCGLLSYPQVAATCTNGTVADLIQQSRHYCHRLTANGFASHHGVAVQAVGLAWWIMMGWKVQGCCQVGQSQSGVVVTHPVLQQQHSSLVPVGRAVSRGVGAPSLLAFWLCQHRCNTPFKLRAYLAIHEQFHKVRPRRHQL